MFFHPMKNLNVFYFVLFAFIFGYIVPISALSSLARNDPYPVYSTLDPHFYLYRGARFLRRVEGWDGPWHERFSFSISPFGQNATRGRNNEGRVTSVNNLMGNPTGRTNMIALLLGPAPTGQTLPPQLVTAQQTLFPGVPTPIEFDPIADDPLFNLGFFSFPAKYHKRGVRFEFLTQLFCDFGFKFQAGVADICQTVTAIVDHTCQTVQTCDFLCPTQIDATTFNTLKCNVGKTLMSPFKTIAQQLGLDISNFHAVSIEEVRFTAFWCKPFEFNITNPYWPDFQLFPFLELSGSISPGKRLHPNQLFGAVFGNDGHSAVGGKGGMAFNFVETIEIAGEIGFTHFFERTVCNLRVPNSIYQSGIYPFATSVKYRPGTNWHFAGKLAATHFIDKLSFWFEYVMVDHGFDHLCLVSQDPAFVPETLAKITDFKYKVANIAFNYDISPTISLGFLWQAPLAQKNTYRTTTLMASFNVIL